MRSESELYSLWEQYARPGCSFACRTGEQVTVVSPGRRNTGPGPDYPGAVLLVDGRLRTGAVEMHLRESEWFEHGHQNDPAYQQVILHLLDCAGASFRLAIPTVDAARLVSDESIGHDSSGGRDGGEAVSSALLMELSWERLLRRTTATLRQIGSETVVDLERTLLRMIFDGLGYSSNRQAMRRVADEVISGESELRQMSFEELAWALFAIARVDRAGLWEIGRTFIPDDRLAKILPEKGGLVAPDWSRHSRPANTPERRIWGAAKLLFDLYRHDLFGRLAATVRAGGGIDALVTHLSVRLGSEVAVGRARASEIALNGVLPTLLAAGLSSDDVGLIGNVCTSYRNAPAQSPNRHLKLFLERFGIDLSQRGAFWQQGGIELVQRYYSDDRAGLSFIAECRHVAA